jgi:heme/copper-type cytochrome/quinol oxidase subunit 2
MNSKDAMKVLVMLAVAVAVVASYCYARVDLGMTLAQVNQALEQWLSKASQITILIWGQIIVAAIAGLVYKVWRHHKETSRQTTPDSPHTSMFNALILANDASIEKHDN